MQVGFPGFHQSHIGLDPSFQNGCDSVELLMLFPLGNQSADSCPRIETGNAGASRAHAFGKRALRAELDLQLARKKLSLKLDVFAHVAGDHLLHLPRPQEQPKAPVIHAGVVAGNGQVAHAGVAQGCDQRLGNPAQAKSPNSQQHPIPHNVAQSSVHVRPQLRRNGDGFESRFRHVPDFPR